MRSALLVAAGAILTAGCGSVLGHRLGLEGASQALIAGFAVGIALLAQAPSAALLRRIEALEGKLAK